MKRSSLQATVTGLLFALPFAACDCGGGTTPTDAGSSLTCGAGTVEKDSECVAEETDGPAPDAGAATDAGLDFDAGAPDAGVGEVDAGATDAGVTDAGDPTDSVTIPSVSISPRPAYNDDSLSCLADVVVSSGSQPTVRYNWRRVNPDTELGDGPTIDLAGRNIGPGDVVTCTAFATVSDEVAEGSASVTIGNRAPTLPDVALGPASPEAGYPLSCTVTSSSTDPDGDALSYTYVWRKNDTQFRSETSTELSSSVEGGNVVAGDSWTCEVVASDGRGGMSSPVVRSVVVHGAAPLGFVEIPASQPSFTQGPNTWTDTTISREVTISRSFYMQATEVTQQQWRDVMGNNPSGFLGCDDCPVERVSWWDALAYMNKLSTDEGLQQCYDLSGCTGTPGTGSYTCSGWTASRFEGLSCTGYRLPTEAEWEYAARARTTGERYGDVNAIAWHSGNSGGSTHPVGQKIANEFGLYDMLGNVWEWTWDWYEPYPSTSVTDPLGPNTGLRRVNRGGSWVNFDVNAVAAHRGNVAPSFRDTNQGFRPARTIP